MSKCRMTHIVADERVIHTQYFGNVSADFIHSAIEEWSALLVAHPSVNYLMFDYTDANLTALTNEDVSSIAQRTDELLKLRPSLEFIGVMPKSDDYAKTEDWAQQVTESESRGFVPSTHIVSSIEAGMEIVA